MIISKTLYKSINKNNVEMSTIKSKTMINGLNTLIRRLRTHLKLSKRHLFFFCLIASNALNSLPIFAQEKVVVLLGSEYSKKKEFTAFINKNEKAKINKFKIIDTPNIEDSKNATEKNKTLPKIIEIIEMQKPIGIIFMLNNEDLLGRTYDHYIYKIWTPLLTLMDIFTSENELKENAKHFSLCVYNVDDSEDVSSEIEEDQENKKLTIEDVRKRIKKLLLGYFTLFKSGKLTPEGEQLWPKKTLAVKKLAAFFKLFVDPKLEKLLNDFLNDENSEPLKLSQIELNVEKIIFFNESDASINEVTNVINSFPVEPVQGFIKSINKPKKQEVNTEDLSTSGTSSSNDNLPVSPKGNLIIQNKTFFAIAISLIFASILYALTHKKKKNKQKP